MAQRDEVLIEEVWTDKDRKETFRLVIYQPTPHAQAPGKVWTCRYHVHGLHDAPHRHEEASPILALRGALTAAVEALEAVTDARPEAAYLGDDDAAGPAITAAGSADLPDARR